MNTEASAPAPTKPFPGFTQGLGVLGLWFALSIPASIPALVAKFMNFHGTAAWLTLAGSLGATAGALLLAAQWGRCSWRAFLPHQRVDPLAWVGTLVGALGLILLLNGIDNAFQHLWPIPEWLHRMMRDVGAPAVVLGAALTEEPLCRGVLLRGFHARYGARRALVYSALVFALIHFNPWQAIGAFALGLYFGWLVQRTGSIWPAVLAHALNNGIAWLAMQRRWTYLGDHQLQPWTWWVAGILLTAAGLHLIRLRPGAEPPRATAPLAAEAQP